METLETLAVALGLASLAGINLYLTVFVTGLAVNLQWIDLSAKYPELLVLGEPAVLITAGLLAGLEFFADKIPWVDSFWDAVHTLIRPIGGGIIALTSLGPVDPAFGVIVALLAGGTSFMTHGIKAGTRLAINHSPEPASNVAMSLAEDSAVIAGLAIMSFSPLLFLGIVLVSSALILFMAPKLYRRVKALSWLLMQKVRTSYCGKPQWDGTSNSLRCRSEAFLAPFCETKPEVKWSLPVVVGSKRKFRKFIPNTFGHLFLLHNDPGVIHFVGEKGSRHYHSRIELQGLTFFHEPRFASEDLVLENFDSGQRLVLRLTAGSEQVARRVVEELTASAQVSGRNAPPRHVTVV